MVAKEHFYAENGRKCQPDSKPPHLQNPIQCMAGFSK